jgi:hypothetical protein
MSGTYVRCILNADDILLLSGSLKKLQEFTVDAIKHALYKIGIIGNYL